MRELASKTKPSQNHTPTPICHPFYTSLYDDGNVTVEDDADEVDAHKDDNHDNVEDDDDDGPIKAGAALSPKLTLIFVHAPSAQSMGVCYEDEGDVVDDGAAHNYKKGRCPSQ